MLEENQYQDVQNVVNALRDKGHIQSDRNRKTTKRRSRMLKENLGVLYSIILNWIKNLHPFLA